MTVGPRYHGDLSHIADFVAECCESSAFGEPIAALYDEYLIWAITSGVDAAPFGLFSWWLRRHGPDSIWLGRGLGEWVVGLSISVTPNVSCASSKAIEALAGG